MIMTKNNDTSSLHHSPPSVLPREGRGQHDEEERKGSADVAFPSSHGSVHYRDFSTFPDHNPSEPVIPNDRLPNFPAKMMAILCRQDLSDIVSWMPHGRSWKVHKPKEFEATVIPAYFDQTKFSSFIRQANGWGFRRVLVKGPDQNSYYHEKFLRGKPHLIKIMKRPTVSKIRIPQELVPNFQRISEEYPLPEVHNPDEIIRKLNTSKKGEHVSPVATSSARYSPMDGDLSSQVNKGLVPIQPAPERAVTPLSSTPLVVHQAVVESSRLACTSVAQPVAVSPPPVSIVPDRSSLLLPPPPANSHVPRSVSAESEVVKCLLHEESQSKYTGYVLSYMENGIQKSKILLPAAPASSSPTPPPPLVELTSPIRPTSQDARFSPRSNAVRPCTMSVTTSVVQSPGLPSAQHEHVVYVPSSTTAPGLHHTETSTGILHPLTTHAPPQPSQSTMAPALSHVDSAFMAEDLDDTMLFDIADCLV